MVSSSRPSARTGLTLLIVHETMLSCIEMSSVSPRPVFSRLRSAIRIPESAISEPAMSTAGMPRMPGSPSLPRLRLTIPDSAAIDRSCAGRCASGPVWPKAEIEQ